MNYSKRFLKPKQQKPIRTIDEYVKAKKRFSSANFTVMDKQQIESTIEGFIIINNCKIPIKSGALDLRIWINKHEKTIIPLTIEQKAANKKASQKAYRLRQKAKLLNPIEEIELNHDITSLNMPHIFRDYTEKRKASTCPKRIITAKRIIPDKPKVHYQQNRAKFGANIPIQHLLKTAQWLVDLTKEKGEKSKYETYKQYLAKVNNASRTYIEVMEKAHKRKGLIV